MSTANTLIDNTLETARKTRRAYIGALGITYDFAKSRAELRRAQISSLFSSAVERGAGMESEAKEFFDRAKAEAEEMTSSVMDEVKDDIEDAKDAIEDVKEDIVLTAKKAEKHAELAEKVEESDKYGSYVEKVQGYDKTADPVIIKKIVDHLGIALQSRDTMFVACSDEAERKTVAESWLSKTLGVDGDADALDAKVQSVCQTMKADRLKDRVTFYYLAAKAEGKLEKI